MKYEDGVNVDSNKRVTKCPKCGNEQFGDNDQFCIICGTELYNYCTGENYTDDWGNGKGEIHKNIGNARYCAVCGAPTIYFEKKILKPYTEYNIDNSVEEIKAFPDINKKD